MSIQFTVTGEAVKERLEFFSFLGNVMTSYRLANVTCGLTATRLVSQLVYE